MKTIDWTKPLRQNGGMATIIKGLEYIGPLKGSNNHIVRIYPVSQYDTGEPELVEYTSYGMCVSQGRQAYTLENVPEEPADTICLYRRGERWYVNAFGVNGKPWARQQVAPRSAWEAEYPGGLGPDRMLVKVPV